MSTAAPLLAALLALAPLRAPQEPSRANGEGSARRGAGATLLVLLKSEAEAAFLDPDTGAVRAILPTGTGPHEVAVSPDGALAVVTNYGGGKAGSSLSVLALEPEPKVRRVIELEGHSRPHGVVFLGSTGRVLVTAEDQRALLEVDLESGVIVRALPTDQAVSHMVAASPDGRRAYVSNIGSGSLTVFDLVSGQRLANVETGPGAEGLDVAPDGREVWVANREADTLSVVDAETLEVSATLACADFPIRLKFTPDGRRVLVSNARSGDVALFDAELREELARIPMRADAVDAQGRLFGPEFSDGPVPIGILVQPDGRFAYVANANADAVSVLDLERRAVVDRLDTGDEPDGLGWISP